MSEKVLVLKADRVKSFKIDQGFTPVKDGDVFMCLPCYLSFIPREDAEEDPTYKQVIPYVIITRGDEVMSYRRKGGGEGRLEDRRSIGVGGHVNPEDEDLSDEDEDGCITSGMLRELYEEVDIDNFTITQVGWINDDSDPVGQVHLGVVYQLKMHPGGQVSAVEDCLQDLQFKRPEEWLEIEDQFESWSRICLQAIVGKTIPRWE